jgi:hypothetical protein
VIAGQCCHEAVGRKIDLQFVFLAVPRRAAVAGETGDDAPDGLADLSGSIRFLVAIPFHYDIELTSRIAPPAAAISTTIQGGNLQLIKATKQVSASAKSRGEPIALIQSGS